MEQSREVSLSLRNREGTGKQTGKMDSERFVAVLLRREEWDQGRLVEAGVQEVEQGQGWGWDHLTPGPAMGLQPYKHIPAHSLGFTEDIEEQNGMEDLTMDAPAAAGARSHSPQTKNGV